MVPSSPLRAARSGRVSMKFPSRLWSRPRRRLRGISTSWPRRRRDPVCAISAPRFGSGPTEGCWLPHRRFESLERRRLGLARAARAVARRRGRYVRARHGRQPGGLEAARRRAADDWKTGAPEAFGAERQPAIDGPRPARAGGSLALVRARSVGHGCMVAGLARPFASRGTGPEALGPRQGRGASDQTVVLPLRG